MQPLNRRSFMTALAALCVVRPSAAPVANASVEIPIYWDNKVFKRRLVMTDGTSVSQGFRALRPIREGEAVRLEDGTVLCLAPRDLETGAISYGPAAQHPSAHVYLHA